MSGWAALGMGAAGRLIGNMSDLYGTGRHLRGVKNQEQLAQERASFLGRIDAAKAAGIHPLVALGGSGFGGGGASAGGSDPIAPIYGGDRKDPNIERYNAARADLAELQVQEARKKLAGQPGNQGGAVMVGDQWTEKPAEVTSVARGIPFLQAGPPASTEQVFSVRNPITGETQRGNLPGSDVGEKIENMGEFWQAVLMTPMAGRFLWDAFVPDRWKSKIFDFLDALGGARRGDEYKSDPAYQQWLRSGRR